MFITHPPRQTRHKRFVSARTVYPCAHTPHRRGRATSERERPTRDSGRVAPRQGTVGGSALTPTGRGLARFSRHVFLGVFWLLVVIFAEIREDLRGVWAFFGHKWSINGTF